MVASFATNKSKVTLADVTPLARLTGEYNIVVVPTKSPIKSLKDLRRAGEGRRRARCPGPAARPAATTTCSPASIVQAAGVDPRQTNYVAFSGGGDSLASIIGGQVTVGVGGYSELIEQVKAGNLRALGDLRGRPRARHRHADAARAGRRTCRSPTGAASPRRRSSRDEQRQAYLALIDKVVKSPTWKDAAREERLGRRLSRRRRLPDLYRRGDQARDRDPHHARPDQMNARLTFRTQPERAARRHAPQRERGGRGARRHRRWASSWCSRPSTGPTSPATPRSARGVFPCIVGAALSLVGLALLVAEPARARGASPGSRARSHRAASASSPAPLARTSLLVARRRLIAQRRC